MSLGTLQHSDSDEPSFSATVTYLCTPCSIEFPNYTDLCDHLRNEHASVHATSELDFAEQILGLRTQQADTQTPPPGNIYSVGANLARFHDLRLALSKPSPDQLTSSTVAAYLKGPQVRKLTVVTREDPKGTWIDVTSPREQGDIAGGLDRVRCDLTFCITLFHFNDRQKALLCTCLQELMERVPAPVYDLPYGIRRWLLTVAQMRAKTLDPTMQLSLEAPKFKTGKAAHPHQRSWYAVPLVGYDPSTKQSWKFSYRLFYTHIDTGLEEDFSDFTWKEAVDHNLDPEEAAGSIDHEAPGFTTEEKVAWLSTARMLAVKCFGFIGTLEELDQYIGQQLRRKPPKKPKATGLLRPGGTICRHTSHGRWLLPARKLDPSIQSLKISIRFPTGTETIDVFEAVEMLFESLRGGHTFPISWALACITADQTISRSRQGLPRGPIMSCIGTSCDRGTHLCPTCWRIRLCGDFVESIDFEYKICNRCKFENTMKVAIKDKKPEDQSLIHRYLSRHLTNLLKNEHRSAKIETKNSNPSVYGEAQDIMQTLKPLSFSEHQCHDNIIEQDLTITAIAKLT